MNSSGVDKDVRPLFEIAHPAFPLPTIETVCTLTAHSEHHQCLFHSFHVHSSVTDSCVPCTLVYLINMHMIQWSMETSSPRKGEP